MMEAYDIFFLVTYIFCKHITYLHMYIIYALLAKTVAFKKNNKPQLYIGNTLDIGIVCKILVLASDAYGFALM